MISKNKWYIILYSFRRKIIVFLVSLIKEITARTLASVQLGRFIVVLIFTDILLLGFFNPVSLDEFFKKLYQQIYNSFFDILVISILIAILLIGISENLTYFIGDTIRNRLYIKTITVIVPGVIALLFLIKYSSSLITMIEKYKDHDTFTILKYLGVNPVTIYITPATLAGILSIMLLSFFTAILSVIFSGYLFKIFVSTSPSFFYNTVLSSLNISDIINFIMISIIFGVALTLIPMYNAYRLDNINRMNRASQVSLGLVRIFYLYLFIFTVGFVFL